MTVATATAFTISHTTEQEVLADLEVEFDNFRSRIATLSVEACGTLTDMFSPLGPADEGVIDLKAVEWEQFELDLTDEDAVVVEFAAA